MTSAELKSRFRDSARSVRDGLCISASHPDDISEIMIQTEMDPLCRQLTERRFHCFYLAESEVEPFIKHIRHALKHAKKLREAYNSEVVA